MHMCTLASPCMQQLPSPMTASPARLMLPSTTFNPLLLQSASDASHPAIVSTHHRGGTLLRCCCLCGLRTAGGPQSQPFSATVSIQQGSNTLHASSQLGSSSYGLTPARASTLPMPWSSTVSMQQHSQQDPSTLPEPWTSTQQRSMSLPCRTVSNLQESCHPSTAPAHS